MITNVPPFINGVGQFICIKAYKFSYFRNKKRSSIII